MAIAVVGLAILCVSGGCTSLELIKNYGDICSIINCSALGIVDVAGPRNPLVPSTPDYSLDPTCTLPGMCGTNPWYPYSIAAGGSQ